MISSTILAFAVVVASSQNGGGPPRLDVKAAVRALFEAEGVRPAGAERCVELHAAEQVDCFLGLRFAGDAKAAVIARDVYKRTGSVCGVLPAQTFDGAYRGKVALVPHVPTGKSREHLAWLAAGLFDLEMFFGTLSANGEMRYRWRALEVRFFRSVKRRTPSAIAFDWTVAYNVDGSRVPAPFK